MDIIEIAALFRYPVKSMGGERVDRLEVTATGAAGDRNWAVIDTDSRSIRSAKRWPALLGLQARYLEPPVVDAYDERVAPVLIEAPNGESRRSDAPDRDAWLSGQLGKPARLSARRPAADRDHYRLASARTPEEIASDIGLLDDEVLPDFGENEDALLASLRTSATPPGTYVDAYPLHLITETSLDTLGARSGLDPSVLRFRPNLLVRVVQGEGTPELSWVGRQLRVGDSVRLRVRSPTFRCTMPSRAQPLQGVAAEPGMTRALATHAQRVVGINVLVEVPGTIRVGDRISVVEGDS